MHQAEGCDCRCVAKSDWTSERPPRGGLSILLWCVSPHWHLADNAAAPTFVRFWTKANKGRGRFSPGTANDQKDIRVESEQGPGPLPKTDCHAYDVSPWSSGQWNMTRKSIKTRAQETVAAAAKSAAKGTKTLTGELANAAAAAAVSAAATATAAPGVAWDKVATAIGAKKLRSRAKKKVAKKVASKKRTTLKKKANKKKASRRSAKKKRL